MSNISLIDHYKKLWFFNFKRFEDNNYEKMRHYLADVFIDEIEQHVSLDHKKVVDVGGAQGEFCQILSEKRDVDATNVDPLLLDYVWEKSLEGSAHNLPFSDLSIDVVLCRAVIEHVPYEHKAQSVHEIFRVLKPGGYAYFLIPPWWNPFAGHQLKPFHYLPFKWAKFLRESTFGNKIPGDSYEDEGLYPITFAELENHIQTAGFTIEKTLDTHFKLHFLTKIPLLREFMIPAVSFIVKKPI